MDVISHLETMFGPERKHAFLVGAGISIDNPSNLLSSIGFLANILQRISPSPNVFEKLRINTTRFEKMMSILESNVDDQLEILNCLSDCSAYNLNHSIIAGLLFKGNTVITTNFDILVERALLDQFGIEPDVILDEGDCSNYLAQPKSIFKIHGSLFRYVQGRWQDSRDSIRATLGRIGRSGEAFELEPSMQKLLIDILTNHDFIVIGYSGSDDFDVMPLLRSIKSKACLVWVNHVEEKDTFLIHSLDKMDSSSRERERNRQCLRILEDLEGSESWRNDRIFLVEANAQCFLKKIAQIKAIQAKESTEVHDWNVDQYFDQWGRKHLSTNGVKELVCGQLFADIGYYDDAINLYNSCLSLIPFDDPELPSKTYYQLASVHSIKGDYKQVEDLCRKAMILLGPTISPFKAAIFDLLGKVCGYQGKYDAAEEYHNECLNLSKEILRADLIASSLHYLGRVWHIRGDLTKAEGFYLDSARFFSKCGHIQGYALCLHQLGLIYQNKNHYVKAKEYYAQSLKLREKLKDKLGIAASLHQLGCIEFFRGNTDEAMSMIFKSLNLEKEINHSYGISDSLAMLGFMHFNLGKFHEAYSFYQQSLEIDLKLNRQSEANETLLHLTTIRNYLSG